MRKLKFLALTTLLLALLFAGCDSGGGGDSDTWYDITSLDQLNGTWKGSNTATKTMKEWGEIWEADWRDSVDEIFGNMSMKTTWERIITINGGKCTGTDKSSDTFSGGKINTAWPNIVDWWAGENATVNNSNHSLSFNSDFSFSYAVNEQWFQINQDGKKIKFNGSTRSIYIDMILTKQ